MEPDAEHRALICAPFGRDAALLERLCRDAGCEAMRCAGGEDLMKASSSGFLFIVLTEEACTAATIAGLRAIWQARPSWSHPPLLLLLDSPDHMPGPLSELIVDQAISTCLLLKRPLDRRTLLRAIETQASFRRRQYDLRDAMQDLTSAREQSDFLLQELRHRVGNMLNTLGALFHMSAQSTSDVDQLKEAFRGRLDALGTVHRRLIEADNDDLSLRQLIEDGVGLYCPSADRLVFDGPDINVKAKPATSLTMVLHELSTNARKYGAFGDEGGVVRIEWTVSETAGDEPGFRLEWQESKGPPVATPEREGFGSVMLEQVAAAEFGGSAELHYEPAGLRFVLEGKLG